MKKISIYLFGFLILFTCTKEEVTTRSYPRVRTKSVVDISSTGAKFSGDITFTSTEILDHGFIWSINNNLFLTDAETISLGPKVGKGQFETLVERSLAEGMVYYVKAYAKSNGYTVYGEVQKFISLGSKAPIVSGVVPNTGTWSDTIRVIGENFSRFSKYLKVSFDADSAKIIKASIDTIICIVPSKLSRGPSDVSVSFMGNVGKGGNLFQLKTPVINSINPSVGTANEPVTIQGEFFSLTHSKVYFNGLLAAITEITPHKIICKVPQQSIEGSIPLKVETGEGNLHTESTFNYKKPRVISISPLIGTYGDVISIEGEYFANDINFNVVKFGDVNATIQSITPTAINVFVPPSLATPSHQISLTYGTEKIIYAAPFVLLPPEIIDVNPKKINFGEEFLTIKGKNFSPLSNSVLVGGKIGEIIFNSSELLQVKIPTISSHQITLSVTSSGQTATFGMLLSPWVRSQDSPFHVVPYFQLPLDGHILIFNTVEDIPLPFYEFDPLTNSWNQRNPPPDSVRGSFGFSINGKSYMDGGYRSLNLWEYDYNADSWTLKNNLPSGANFIMGFSINNKGYFFGGNLQISTSNYNQLWEYDPNSNGWSRKSDFGGIGEGSLGFIFNNKFYFVSGVSSQYYLNVFDPITNQWTYSKIIFPNGYTGRYPWFWHDSKLYFGDNDIGEGTLNEYDIINQQWVPISNHPYIRNARTLYLNSVRYFTEEEFFFWELYLTLL